MATKTKAPAAPLADAERDALLARDVARRDAYRAGPSWPERGARPPVALQGLALARQEAARRLAALADAASASDVRGCNFEPSTGGGGGGASDGPQAQLAGGRVAFDRLLAAVGDGVVALDARGGRVSVAELVARVVIREQGLAGVLAHLGLKRSRGRVCALFDALDAAMGRVAAELGLEGRAGHARKRDYPEDAPAGTAGL